MQKHRTCTQSLEINDDILLCDEQNMCVMQALLLAQLGWLVNVYDARQRSGDAWDAHSAAHAQNVVLGRRAHLALQRAGALEQARCAVCCLMEWR